MPQEISLAELIVFVDKLESQAKSGRGGSFKIDVSPDSDIRFFNVHVAAFHCYEYRIPKSEIDEYSSNYPAHWTSRIRLILRLGGYGHIDVAVNKSGARWITNTSVTQTYRKVD